MNLAQYFDKYSFSARVTPTLLAIAPALMTVTVEFPELFRSAGKGLVSLLLYCGVLVLLANGTRWLGRKKEQKLYKSWGGIPTTVWLRHRDNNLDPITKKRYHSFLSKNIFDLKLPSESEEILQPDAADITYRSAIKWLLERTRDTKKFKLIFAENINYGFCRNTYALKPIAIVIAFVSALIPVFIAWRLENMASLLEPSGFIPLCIAVIATILWIVLVSEAWVRDSSNAYARALLAACDQIQQESKRK